MNVTLKAWLVGLANAAISGVASGGIATGLGVNWKQALAIAVGSALVSAIKWAAQHPIPSGQ